MTAWGEKYEQKNYAEAAEEGGEEEELEQRNQTEKEQKNPQRRH